MPQGARVMPDLHASLRDVHACPLCGDTHSDARAAPQPNLYSEQLALLLGCDEAQLLSEVQNHRCATCGLWYKARWFLPTALAALFEERIPDHPKGWDAVSDRFSVRGFALAVQDLRSALESGETVDKARTRRALGSIIDSLQIDQSDERALQLQHALSEGDVGMLDSLAASLAQYFVQPAPFKRFSGFSSPLLWDWMVSHIGPVHRYGEIGCPLWGQLVGQREAGVQRTYFARTERNYWGRGCTRDGQHCSARLADAGVGVSAWPPPAGDKLDALGAFQYLDHLQSPVAFIGEVFAHSRALMLVLDDGAAPSAIQHATGWDVRSVAWLARRFDKRVFDDFAPILPSGNHAWLLCDG